VNTTTASTEQQFADFVTKHQRNAERYVTAKVGPHAAPDIVQESVLRPLNQKMGQQCFSMAGTSGSEVTVNFAAACATPQARSKLEAGPPAGSALRPSATSAPVKAIPRNTT